MVVHIHVIIDMVLFKFKLLLYTVYSSSLILFFFFFNGRNNATLSPLDRHCFHQCCLLIFLLYVENPTEGFPHSNNRNRKGLSTELSLERGSPDQETTAWGFV